MPALASRSGIIDISGYGKHFVRGTEAHDWLQHVMANRMPREDGLITLTPMLTHGGKLMGEFTVARVAADEFHSRAVPEGEFAALLGA